MKVEDLRVIGGYVGHFSEKEALTYAMKRMPRSLKDANRIAQIARKVVSVFDGSVFTLQKACAEIRKGDPTELDTIKRGSRRRKLGLKSSFLPVGRIGNEAWQGI
jgi:hypothetical protein